MSCWGGSGTCGSPSVAARRGRVWPGGRPLIPLSMYDWDTTDFEPSAQTGSVSCSEMETLHITVIMKSRKYVIIYTVLQTW